MVAGTVTGLATTDTSALCAARRRRRSWSVAKSLQRATAANSPHESSTVSYDAENGDDLRQR